MALEHNKTLVRRFIDAYNARNLYLFDDLVAPDYIDHTHQQQGRGPFRQLFTLAFEGFPDWHEEIEDMIAEGDKVWVWVTARGTHTGKWNLFGVTLPPTGRAVTMPMVFIWRIEDGRLAEGWEVDSEVNFLRNIGVLEYTERGKKIFVEETSE